MDQDGAKIKFNPEAAKFFQSNSPAKKDVLAEADYAFFFHQLRNLPYARYIYDSLRKEWEEISPSVPTDDKKYEPMEEGIGTNY